MQGHIWSTRHLPTLPWGAQWIRPQTLNCEVPGSNLLAAAVVSFGQGTVSFSPGVLKLFLRRAGWDSSATWKSQNCFRRGGRICAQSPLRLGGGGGGGPGPTEGPWKLWGYRCSLMQSEPYIGRFTICLKPFYNYFYSNILCNIYTIIVIIYKMITIIVIILDPCVLKRAWNWGDNAVKVVTQDLHNIRQRMK